MGLKVIGAGLGRTGTLSLKRALEELGFGACFHGGNMFTHQEIIDFTYAAAKGEQVDWSNAFNDEFQSAVDFPSAFFYKELIEANPEAKVILTVREAETWYNSNMEVFGLGFPEIAELGSRRDKIDWVHFQYFYKGKFGDKQFTMNLFNEHVRTVQETVPKEKLLVFSVKEGWEPLCAFLQVDIPSIPFPNVNDRESMKTRVQKIKQGVPGATRLE